MLDNHVKIVGEVRAESKLTQNNFLKIIEDSCKNNKLNLREDINISLNKLSKEDSEYFKTRVGWNTNGKTISLITTSIKHRVRLTKARGLEYVIVSHLRDDLRALVLKKTNIRI